MPTTAPPEPRAAGSDPTGRRGRLDPIAVPALLAATFVYLLARSITDADLWGHVRFGLDLLASGRLVRPDPYSYTSPGAEWINHEWLTEAIFAIAYRAAGGSGLVVLKVVLGVLLFGLLYAHLVRRGLRPIRAGMLVLLAYVPISVGTMTVRPQMFTYLCFLLVVLAIEAAERGRPRWLWSLPAVFAFWANAHGGFLAGVAVLALWTAARLIADRSRVRRRLGAGLGGAPLSPVTPIAVLGLSLLATLANPYGPGLWEFLIRTATVPRPEITEWSPVSLLTLDGQAYLVLAALTGILLARRSPPPAAPLLLVYAAVLPMPIMALRHLPLFVLVALVVAAVPLAELSHRLGSPAGARRRTVPGWFPAILLAGAAVMLALAAPRFRGVVIDGERQPAPARAVALLDSSGVAGNLAVHFDWGEYAIWHLAPGVRVSWDGRRETVYDEETYRTNLMFFFGALDWSRLLREHETDMALVLPASPVYNLLEATEPWTVVYEDSLAALFAREGSPQALRIAGTPLPDLPPTGDGLLFP